MNQRTLDFKDSCYRLADDADDAMVRTAERNDDVLVCDSAMPGVDGYALLRRIREREVATGRFTPAVAVSAFADCEAERRGLDAGYRRFVAKPYDFGDLVAAVDSLAQARQNRVGF